MLSAYHAGDIGDVIYALYVTNTWQDVHLMLGERTRLGNLQPREGISFDKYRMLVPLLNTNTTISRLDWCANPPFCRADLNEFRLFWTGQLPLTGHPHLLEMVCARFSVPFDPNLAWLRISPCRKSKYIFARSPRHQNNSFPWAEIVAKYGKEALFVGHRDEYEAFATTFDRRRTVNYYKIVHFLELATLIAGCDVFVGNSSMPLAIAEGLKKCVVQEVSPTVEKAHTILNRDGCFNWEKSSDSLPFSL